MYYLMKDNELLVQNESLDGMLEDIRKQNPNFILFHTFGERDSIPGHNQVFASQSDIAAFLETSQGNVSRAIQRKGRCKGFYILTLQKA